MTESANRPTVLLLERAPADVWSVFVSTRPIATLRWGAFTLGNRVVDAAVGTAGGVVATPGLEGFDEEGSLHPVPLPALAGEGGLLLWDSTAPPTGPIPTSQAGVPTTFIIQGRIAGRYFPAGTPVGELGVAGIGEDAAEPTDRPDELRQQIEGLWLEAPWHLVATSSDQLARDLEAMAAPDTLREGYSALAPREGVHLQGPWPVLIGAHVEIGPGVVFDTREGPILLDRGVRVEGPARLTGPLHLDEHTLVFGGSIGRSSIGPWCKLRGEVSESVLLGWSNKAHDGHLGHALLGRWVNLGAGTTNSDLRNDYGPVTVKLPGSAPQPTGLTKVGCLLGDHVKTGIGTLLNTGAVVGAGCQIAGGGLAPTPLSPFTWATSEGSSLYRWDRFESTARTVMARRDRTLTSGVATVLERVHQNAARDQPHQPAPEPTP